MQICYCEKRNCIRMNRLKKLSFNFSQKLFIKLLIVVIVKHEVVLISTDEKKN